MSRRESPSKISTTTSLTPPPAKYTPMTDTPMLEAPTSTTQLQTAVTADRIKQEQQPQLQHPAPEHAPPMTDLPPTSTFPREHPPMTDLPPTSTFPREHPPREPTSRQPTPRLYDNITPDRKPLHLSAYPTAPNSLPQTPHPVMPAPSALRAHAGTPTTDRVPHVSSYPTAPGSAAQTPQPGKSRTSQHGMSSAGWLVPPAAKSTSKITFEDYLSLSEITFEWGDSYDDKDWMRLRAILAPTLMVDYSQVNGHVWSSMPAEEFVRVMSHIGFVGDPLVHTQHHIGASKWAKISDDEAVGHHQLRAAHQRYTALDRKTVENKGHGHAMVKHFYRKVDGEWKLAGLRPTVRWNEFEFEKIFRGF